MKTSKRKDHQYIILAKVVYKIEAYHFIVIGKRPNSIELRVLNGYPMVLTKCLMHLTKQNRKERIQDRLRYCKHPIICRRLKTKRMNIQHTGGPAVALGTC